MNFRPISQLIFNPLMETYSTLSMILSLILIMISTVQVAANDGGVYSLKKKIQFPGHQQPSSFAIKSDDQILAAVYGQPNSPNPKYAIYTGDQFQNIVQNYDLPKLAYGDVSISNSGIYASQAQNIVKYPFRSQIQFDRYLNRQYSIVSLDSKTWAYVAKNYRKCPVIQVVSAYKAEIKQINLDIWAGCNGEKNGQLYDLKNGQVAFVSFNYLHIIDKKVLKNDQNVVSIQSINMTEMMGVLTASVISSFYNPEKNESTIFTYYSNKYYVLHLNKTSQTYYYRNEIFYHPATKCQFYNDTTCYAFLENYFIINQNVQNQIINVKYDYNPFTDSLPVGINNDESLLAMNNIQTRTIKIYRIGENYKFTAENKTLNYKQQLGDSAQFSKGQFIPGKSQMILKFDFYDNLTEITTSKICKWNPQTFSLNCIQNSPGQDILAGYSLVKSSPNSSNYHLLVAKFKKRQPQLLVISYYLGNELIPQSQYQNPDMDFGIDQVKFIYGQGWDNTFIINAKSWDNRNDSNLYFKIIARPQSINISLESIQVIGTDEQVWSKVSYKNMLVMMQRIDESMSCVIKFYDLKGNHIDFLPKVTYQNCLQYQLQSQNSFDQIIVKRYPSINRVYIEDFYNITLIDTISQNYQFKKRSMFIQIYSNLESFRNLCFVMTKKQVYVHYSMFSNQSEPIRIYNISIVPLRLFKLNSAKGTNFNFSTNLVDVWKDNVKFAYNSRLSIRPYTQDESLYFTINETLYQVFNMYKLINTNELQQFVTVYDANIYKSNLQEFTNESRTFLASTGRHVISILYTNVSSVVVISTISSQQTWVIWTFSSKTIPINAVDMSIQGLALILKPSLIQFEPFSCPNNVYPYNIGSDSVFNKTYVSGSQQLLLFSVKSTFFKKDLVGYSQCLLKADSFISFIESNNSIQQIKGTINSKSTIIVSINSSTISAIINGTLFSQPLNKFNSMFVQMFITFNNVIILRFQDYLVFCSGLQICEHLQTIKSNQILAISQQTGIMAYFKASQNQTQTIEVLKIQSYDKVTSIQNITLGKGKYADGKSYNPKVKRVHFSSSGNLYILTIDALSNEFSSVFYSFSTGECPQNMIMNQLYECICLDNFTNTDITVNGSEIVVSESCKTCLRNFYYSKQMRRCYCPQSFQYSEEKKQCNCVDGDIQKHSNGVNVCVKPPKPNNIWWIILLSILGFFAFVGCICYGIKKCNEKKDKEKKGLLSSLRQTPSQIIDKNEGQLRQSQISNRSSLSSQSSQRSSRLGQNILQQSNHKSERLEVPQQRERDDSSRRRPRHSRNLVRQRPLEEEIIIPPNQKTNLSGQRKVMNTESSIY